MIKIDMKSALVTIEEDGRERVVPLGSEDAFVILSKAWLRAGWDTKYVYGFTWLGRPIIQLPEDLVRVQEAIYRVKPDVVIETGVAHGGSLVFYAGLLKAIGRGRVIGVDIDVRPHNRQAIEAHELSSLITIVQGSSIDPVVAGDVRSMVRPGERVFIMLDSNHSKEHVLRELDAYADLVSIGSWIVAADGIMEEVAGAPRTSPDWIWNNPKAAAREFVERRDEFRIEPPEIPFNEGLIHERVTYWPGAWVKRVR